MMTKRIILLAVLVVGCTDTETFVGCVDTEIGSGCAEAVVVEDVQWSPPIEWPKGTDILAPDGTVIPDPNADDLEASGNRWEEESVEAVQAYTTINGRPAYSWELSRRTSPSANDEVYVEWTVLYCDQTCDGPRCPLEISSAKAFRIVCRLEAGTVVDLPTHPPIEMFYNTSGLVNEQ